jgi:opacity protein-like surface antigen
MWDVMAGAGYDFTDSVSLFAGYRAISVDYGNDGFVYDVVEQGPVVAAVFQF